MRVTASWWDQVYAGTTFERRGGLYVPKGLDVLPSIFPPSLFSTPLPTRPKTFPTATGSLARAQHPMMNFIAKVLGPQLQDFDCYDDYLVAKAEWEYDGSLEL